MPSYIESPNPVFQGFDSNGDPLSGGKLYTYAAGTSTPLATYTDSAGGTPNANPVVLDARGEAAVWRTIGVLYKYVLKTSADVTLWTIDNIGGSGVSSAEFAAQTYTAFTTGGTSTAYTLTPSPAMTANTENQRFQVEFHTASGASPTLAVSGLSALNLKYRDSTGAKQAVTTNTIPSSWRSDVVNDGTDWLVLDVPAVATPLWTISASRGSNAETFTFTPDSGLRLRFRNATAGTGDYAEVASSAALTLTISSGSTLGATNSVPFRVWLVVFNDGGTLRLGAVNAKGEFCLGTFQLLSSTAEGGAGAADSAKVIYTGTAVTTKAFVVVGFADYTLGTVGTWGTAPSKIQIYSSTVPLPGDVVQMQYTASGAVASGATQTPGDDSIPQQSTEGNLFMSLAVIPTAAANILKIEHIGSYDVAGLGCTVALHQDSTESAIAATYADDRLIPMQVSVRKRMVANTTSSTTFKIHAGADAAGTTTFNGVAAGRKMGGVIESFIEITEIMA